MECRGEESRGKETRVVAGRGEESRDEESSDEEPRSDAEGRGEEPDESDEDDINEAMGEECFLIECVEDSFLPDLTKTFKSLLQNVRKIVRYFRKSPQKNDSLQEQLKKAGKEVQLQMDVKTRWNSIITMLDSFLKVHLKLNL